MHGGIDEAGRGPVLGPLVVAGVAAPDAGAFHAMGCRDSKALTPGRRERLHRLIHDLPGVCIVVRVVEAEEVDLERSGASLNDVALRRFREVAAELAQNGARTLAVDAADVDAARFGRRVQEAVPPSVAVDSRHRAESHDPAVAAASIIAKVERDARIADLARRLERRLGMPMGSGYPSDPATIAFLKQWVARHGELPEGVRRTWSTARRLLPTTTLEHFTP